MVTALSRAKRDISRSYVRYAPWSAGKLVLVDRLNAELRDRPRHVTSRTRFGDLFHTSTQDLLQRYIHMFGVWEPHLTAWLRNRLRPGDGFVDVGANVGYVTVLASRLVGSTGKVVAIEASPTFHEVLLGNVALNRCTNVRAVNAAVSDRHEMLRFILASSRNMGANSVVPYDGPAEDTFEIAAQPLPEVVTDDELSRARVLKIDVEGAEGSVLRGLAPALHRLRPDAELVVEVTPHRMAELGDSVEELLTTLRQSGFHTYRLANDYTPASYVAALRQGTQPAVRWRGPVDEESDLVFSRVDAETLP